MAKLKIVYRKIDELIPYENNPRINDKAVDAVAASIKEFGFNVPIVIDADSVIVAGHTRLEAAKILQLSEVPTVSVDSLTDEQVRAYRLADNKTAELAQWDWSKLEEEMDGISLDMSVYGFSKYDYEEINIKDDNASVEVKKGTNIKHGDIFQLGKHRLMCGDSTEAADVRKLMREEKAEMLFTSPPYADMRDYEGGDLDVEHLAAFIPTYKEYVPYQCVNLGIKRYNDEIVQYWDSYIAAARNCGYKLLGWNVWDKCGKMSVGSQQAMIPCRHEWIFVFCDTEEFIFLFGEKSKEINKTWKKKADSVTNKKEINPVRQKDGSMKYSSKGDLRDRFKKMESVLSLLPVNKSEDHPAMFPVELPAQYIAAMTNEEEIVIEPFGGSGTTMIACEQLNRRCRMMELSPEYCEVIIKRWEDYTGEKAEKIA